MADDWGHDDWHDEWGDDRSPSSGRHRPTTRQVRQRRLLVLTALLAVAAVGLTTAALVIDRSNDGRIAATATTTTPATTVPAEVVVTSTTSTTPPPPVLTAPLKRGSSGDEVRALQLRLKELAFEPGPTDGQFGQLTQQAVWAFEKLVLGVPRDQATGVVTPEMWAFMNQPIEIQPRRAFARGEATRNHTEVYLPEQVVVFFVDDKAALISHASSGDGQIWREVVTIDPGERRNENGTEPIQIGLIGESFTPGGVYTYDRMRQGRRQAALGGMYDPAYFNFGIAIHGANNVPLHPDSHGCIRVPRYIGEIFQQYIAIGDQVFVWDGYTEPEELGAQPPAWDRIDPDWAATTTVAPAPPGG